MPTWGSNRETAFAWIKFLNSGDNEDLGGSPLIADAIVGAGGQLSRRSTLSRWSDRKPFFVGLMKAYPVCVVNAPVIPEAYAIMGAMGEEVADAVNEEQQHRGCARCHGEADSAHHGGQRLRLAAACRARGSSKPRA